MIDCCISDDKFNEMAIEEIRKKIKEEIITSYSKADHVRFSYAKGAQPPTIIFVYKMSNLDPNGLNGLIHCYQNEDLKISASLNGNMITISFLDNDGNKVITLQPLPCNLRQLESFLENKYSKISILDGLINPQNERDIIIVVPEEGDSPKQIIINGIELNNIGG